MSVDNVKDRVLAVLLNDWELNSAGVIAGMYKRRFPKEANTFEEVIPAIRDLVRHDVLIEHDVETEVLNDALIEHNEHGQLSNGDLSFIGVDELIALGPKFIVYVHERATQIAEHAADGGLDRALSHLKALPVDSRRWTGLPDGFIFNDQMKQKVISLLRDADDQLGALRLSNRQTSQARALIKAATTLAEAPEPEPNLIWEIIQRLAAIVGLVSVVDSIVKIFRPV